MLPGLEGEEIVGRQQGAVAQRLRREPEQRQQQQEQNQDAIDSARGVQKASSRGQREGCLAGAQAATRRVACRWRCPDAEDVDCALQLDRHAHLRRADAPVLKVDRDFFDGDSPAARSDRSSRPGRRSRSSRRGRRPMPSRVARRQHLKPAVMSRVWSPRMRRDQISLAHQLRNRRHQPQRSSNWPPLT